MDCGVRVVDCGLQGEGCGLWVVHRAVHMTATYLHSLIQGNGGELEVLELTEDIKRRQKKPPKQYA